MSKRLTGLLSAALDALPLTLWAAPIQTVDVSVQTGTGRLAPSVADRIEASVKVIGERVLVGQPSETVAAHAGEYGKVLADVAGRVISGYVVTDVEVRADAATRLVLVLTPYGEHVQEVHTAVDYGNLSPTVHALMASDLAAIDERINALLIGLPLGALDWVGGISDTLVKDEFARRLPEFNAKLEITPAAVTNAKIYLLPQGLTVRTGRVRMASETVPRIFINGAAERVRAVLPEYIGAPQAFLERHREEIAARLLQTAKEDPFISRYDLDLTGTLTIGEELTYTINASTDTWLIDANVALDLGREEKNTRVRGTLGKRVTDHDTFFADVDFFPHDVSWDIATGYMHRFGVGTYLGYRYEWTEPQQTAFLRQEFGPHWYLRWDHELSPSTDSVSVGYRFQDYLGVELIRDEDDYWVRVIGHI